MLACTVVSLLLSWGAMEIEDYANRDYEFQPNSDTENTCFFTEYNEYDCHCTRQISIPVNRRVAWYGIRLECILSAPLILISFWFFWYEEFGSALLIVAHLCAWIKFIGLGSAMAVVLFDDPSFMREIFEKSQFGSYESKLLYSFTMVVLAVISDIFLLASLVTAPFLPDFADRKYRIGLQRPDGSLRYFEYIGPRRQNDTQLGTKAKKGKTSKPNVAVVEAIAHSDDEIEQFGRQANPV
ncbi:unnamed protein product [Caenorhabditis sp. 36 PRJEB53466]|nr:unnamed protein product [Caenorhabditis sp. 36 PRJEB53466]